MKNGEIFYIDFNGNRGSEINSIHLGIVFSMPKVKNMVFCIPLTSPKEKHFKNLEAFKKRNYNELKYQNLVYIDETDSIALLDQMRTISILRLKQPYNVILKNKSKNLIISKISSYIKNVLR